MKKTIITLLLITLFSYSVSAAGLAENGTDDGHWWNNLTSYLSAEHGVHGGHRNVTVQNWLIVNGTLNASSWINASELCFGDGECINAWADVNISGGSSLWTNSSNNATYNLGNVGVNTTAPVASLNLRGSPSKNKSDFTTEVSNAGVLIESDFLYDAYNPGIFWRAHDDNPTKPKAGIYVNYTGSGSDLIFGTSTLYGSGITNELVLSAGSGTFDVSDYELIGKAGSTTLSAGGSGTSILTMYTAAAGAIEFDSTFSTSYFDYGYKGDNRFRIVGSSGNTGIGTITPVSKLDVNGSLNTTGWVNASELCFGDGECISAWADVNVTGAAGESLWTNSSNNATFSIGNVGIGTTSPIEELDVVGDVNVSGNLNASRIALIDGSSGQFPLEVYSVGVNQIGKFYSNAGMVDIMTDTFGPSVVTSLQSRVGAGNSGLPLAFFYHNTPIAMVNDTGFSVFTPQQVAEFTVNGSTNVSGWVNASQFCFGDGQCIDAWGDVNVTGAGGSVNGSDISPNFVEVATNLTTDQISFTQSGVDIVAGDMNWVNFTNATTGQGSNIKARGALFSTFLETSPNAKTIADYVTTADNTWSMLNTSSGWWTFHTNNTVNGVEFLTPELKIESQSTSSDPFSIEASDGSELMRVAETAGGFGYFALKDSAGTEDVLLRTDGSDSYIQTGEFGIGTSSPNVSLHVAGTGAQVVKVDSTDGTSAAIELLRHGAGGDWRIQDISAGNLQINYGTDDETFGSNIMTFRGSGEVGVGTTNPQDTFTVNGTSPISTIESPGSLFRFNAASGINYIQTGLDRTTGSAADLRFTSINAADVWMNIDSTGYIGVNESAPTANLHVQGSAKFNDDNNDADFQVGTTGSDTTLFVDAGNDRVGVGTNTPVSLLDVRGDVNTSGWINATQLCFGDGECINAWADVNVSGGSDNSSWNESLADTLYASISLVGDNQSWNESYADTLYNKNGSDVSYGVILGADWSDVSITESQISDLSHTVDTTVNNSYANLTGLSVGTAFDPGFGKVNVSDSYYINGTQALCWNGSHIGLGGC